jgi:hypothetical protein
MPFLDRRAVWLWDRDSLSHVKLGSGSRVTGRRVRDVYEDPPSAAPAVVGWPITRGRYPRRWWGCSGQRGRRDTAAIPHRSTGYTSDSSGPSR